MRIKRIAKTNPERTHISQRSIRRVALNLLAHEIFDGVETLVRKRQLHLGRRAVGVCVPEVYLNRPRQVVGGWNSEMTFVVFFSHIRSTRSYSIIEDAIECSTVISSVA